MTNFVTQQGRTMTEIIAVLAIIGILSIGLLVGFRYAMDRYEVNDIVNAVNIYATEMKVYENKHNLVQDEVLMGRELLPNLDTRYVYQIQKDTDSTFFITVAGVSGKVCAQLVAIESESFTDIAPNLDSTLSCKDVEDNFVSFFFETVREGCSVCTAISCIDKDEYCPQNQYCVRGKCEDCQNGEFKNLYGECVSCKDSGFIAALDSECNKCTDRFANNNTYWTDTRYCSVCSETKNQSYYAQKSDCYRCDYTFAATHPSNGKSVCYGCEENGYSLSRLSTLEDCNRCSKRYFDMATRICKICPTGTYKDTAGTGCQ